MKEVYLIPGLGADQRVFDFLDLSSFSCHYLSWIEPFKDETIESYAGRLSTQIKSAQPIIVGVSFGGIMAIEIGKQLKADKIIVISSARTKHELPWFARCIGIFRLHKLVPKS